MHERAVKQRIAFAQERDVASLAQMRGDAFGAALVERRQSRAISRVGEMNFRRYGVDERQFLISGRQPRVDDFSRVAAPPRLGEKGHDRRRSQHAHGLDREQFGIARPDADADEAALAHSRSLARALTAAATIALPPLRPRTTIAGKPLASSASFDSAAPTKPTGMPMIAAGLGAPASIISRSRNKAVGALPIATTAPPS